ncbi:MAG: ATPase P [Candidatus Cloacimonetes bacterium]|nr:ATPase P [Candidatus Cloacimonadota bacterium]
MIRIEIPGKKSLQLEYLLLDFNGTIALDGKLRSGVAENITTLSRSLQIHVVTADTFGNALRQLERLPVTCKVIPPYHEAKNKLTYLKKLGKDRSIALGNGANDFLMLKNAALAIAVMQEEGASSTAIVNADIVMKDINEALKLLFNEQRLIATLRE